MPMPGTPPSPRMRGGEATGFPRRQPRAGALGRAGRQCRRAGSGNPRGDAIPTEVGIELRVPAVAKNGAQVPLTILADSALVFAADLGRGTSPNSYHVMFLRMERSAGISVTGTDARGRTARAAARVAVG